MHPPSEPPPADRPAAHPVTASEAGVASRLSTESSPTQAHDHDWSRSGQTLSLRMHTRSNAPSELASDSDSGSDPFYGLQAEQDEPTSPTAPLAPYPPLPPPEARSRAPEFYGFVAWTATYLLFVLYLLWAFLPDDAILALGVTWYPNRCVGIPVLPFAPRRMLMVPCSRPRMAVNLRVPHVASPPDRDARHHVSAHLRFRSSCARSLCIPACVYCDLLHRG